MRVTLIIAAFSLLSAPGCDSDGARRPIGASCDAASQCVGGLCVSSVCLDPERDEDLDGLLNRVEDALGTNLLVADSDGDGVDDPTEVGDVMSAPLDGDGDGKIDALESALLDVDGDCLVDEVDPHDGVSDPPSEEFPQACGGTSEVIVCSGAHPFRGTCAAAFGDMIFACFQPSGSCTRTSSGLDGAGNTITWDNGAEISYTLGASVFMGTYTGPTGAVCGSAMSDFTDPTGADNTTTVTVGVEGPMFMTQDLDEVVTVTCVDSEQQVTLDLADSARVRQCTGGNAEQECTPGASLVTPRASCLVDADCETGTVCCPGPDGSDPHVCVEATQCPSAEAPPGQGSG